MTTRLASGLDGAHVADVERTRRGVLRLTQGDRHGRTLPFSELARRAGMSREGLYKALSADGNPTFGTVLKVCKALGLRVHFESVA